MKDHKIAEKINELRIIALEYAGGDYGRLRTMIQECVADDLKNIQKSEDKLKRADEVIKYLFEFAQCQIDCDMCPALRLCCDNAYPGCSEGMEKYIKGDNK